MMAKAQTRYRLQYELPAGWVDHWLVLGPLAAPIAPPADAAPAPEEPPVATAARAASPPLEGVPTQLSKIRLGGTELFWKLEHTPPDHHIERSLLARGWQQTRLWAFCILFSDSAGEVEAVLTSACPAALWINGQRVSFESAPGNHSAPGCPRAASASVRLPLEAGENRVFLLLEDEGRGERLLSARMQLLGMLSGALTMAVPVLSPEGEYWKTVEAAYASSRLDRAVYSGLERITLLGPEKQDSLMRATVRLQRTNGQIYGEFTVPLFSGEPMGFSSAVELPSGEYQALLMPPLEHYYENQFRPSRALPFQVRNETYYPRATADFEARRAWILQEATRQGGALALLAALAAGRKSQLAAGAVEEAVQQVLNAGSGRLLDLLALLLLERQARAAGEAGVLTEKAQAEIIRAVKTYPYPHPDELSDSEQLLNLVCKVLGGQLAPRVRFAAFGQIGRAVRASAEAAALDWLRQRAVWGYRQADPSLLAAALAALAEYSANAALGDLAAVCLDQMAFRLAVCNFNGLPDPVGSALPAHALKTARLAPGAAVGLLLWGEGVVGSDIGGAAVLAVCDSYHLPGLIQSIAVDRAAPAWTVETSQSGGAGGEVQRCSLYRSALYRLSSILHSGQQPGSGRETCCEHAWQATLGPEAMVFSSAPGSFNQSDYRAAGFWRGNARRPWIAQWQDALICRYGPALVRTLDFTHAYFPVFAFDEVQLAENWAFARKGEAYLGLYADQGLTLVNDGEDAGRELRSPGQVWLCQLGQRGLDGAFIDFCARLSASKPYISEEEVRWTTLRRVTLQMDRSGSLSVDGQLAADQEPIASPYAQLDRSAGRMLIWYGQEGLELRFD